MAITRDWERRSLRRELLSPHACSRMRDPINAVVIMWPARLQGGLWGASHKQAMGCWKAWGLRRSARALHALTKASRNANAGSPMACGR